MAVDHVDGPSGLNATGRGRDSWAGSAARQAPQGRPAPPQPGPPQGRPRLGCAAGSLRLRPLAVALSPLATASSSAGRAAADGEAAGRGRVPVAVPRRRSPATRSPSPAWSRSGRSCSRPYQRGTDGGIARGLRRRRRRPSTRRAAPGTGCSTSHDAGDAAVATRCCTGCSRAGPHGEPAWNARRLGVMYIIWEADLGCRTGPATAGVRTAASRRTPTTCTSRSRGPAPRGTPRGGPGSSPAVELPAPRVTVAGQLAAAYTRPNRQSACAATRHQPGRGAPVRGPGGGPHQTTPGRAPPAATSWRSSARCG